MLFTLVLFQPNELSSDVLDDLSRPYRGDEHNTILTTNAFRECLPGVVFCASQEECFTKMRLLPYSCGRIFVVSDQFVNHPDAECLWSPTKLLEGIEPYTWKRHQPHHHEYDRWSTDEAEYLQLLQTVQHQGEFRMDRTGTGVWSVFGPQLEFDLEKGFPLFTTKRVPFDKVVHEVMWYLSGETDTSYLRANRVLVWEDNTSRAFLDARGLDDYKIGETGPLYGFQWRHFGGDFRDVKNRPGVDQLTRVLHILRTEPTSRRMFLSAWNPVDLDKMCLEPCHVSFQLFVRNGTHLDGKVYLRSNDLFLGAPWNIAAYALLLVMFGHLSGYLPGKLIYTLGDAHVYATHLDAIDKMRDRPLRPLPRVQIVEDKNHPICGWDDFSMEHFQLHNYLPHPPIVAKMAV